jgi:hypothetical protein
MVMRVDPGATLRSPMPWELDLLTDCLNAIPDFLETEASGENAVGHSGPRVRLSWVDL